MTSEPWFEALRDAFCADLHRAFVAGWEASEVSAKMPQQNPADTRERRIEDDFLMLWSFGEER